MVSRVWHGWTDPADAEAYENLLRTDVLPGIADQDIEGYWGAHLLRRDGEDEVEFVTMLWFDSMEAVESFAGENPEEAVVPEEARELLSRYDEEATHYRTVLTPGPGRA